MAPILLVVIKDGVGKNKFSEKNGMIWYMDGLPDI